jgi:S-adenosylmethionine:tRNA ribosyltransferase-isomerase
VRLQDFWYSLPSHLIAQTPLPNRQESRLLVYSRANNDVRHARFFELQKFLNPGDVLVINKTRVIPARIYTRKKSGGKAEILLLKKLDSTRWEVLVGGKNLGLGKELIITDELTGRITAEMDGAQRVMEFSAPLEPMLSQIGHTPLPPYIHEKLDDPERYQTIYARDSGSAAAPTAGLHFTPGLMRDLADFGVEFAEVTLHVGLDTFSPVVEENIEDHKIHSEWCEITAENAERINAAISSHRRIIAVGTTTARTLETAVLGVNVSAYRGQTELFITPGYKFKIVSAMITNFHLPASTLLIMVSAFAGRENILACYQQAIDQQYRFYSFGDAMLIL